MTTAATQTFDDVDRALLREIQRHVPLDHRPFEVLGEKLGISEQECLARVSRLKVDGVIHRLCALLDASALGYQSALVAMRIDPARVDEAANAMNGYPGVTYSDRRNDPFSLWSAVAVPPQESLEQVARVLQALANAEETIILPMLRRYRAGAKPDVSTHEPLVEHQEALGEEPRDLTPKPKLTDEDVRAIRVLQEELPLIELPYAVWAEQAERSEEELFAWIKKGEHLGYVRRVAATLRPVHAGSQAVATVVWQVPDGQADAAGEGIARFREVSHCSRRPVYPRWPYSLFTVFQAATQAACMEAVKRIEDRVGRFPHKNLFRIREYQHRGITYFNPELDRWWAEVGDRVIL